MISWKFHIDSWKTVATVASQTFLWGRVTWSDLKWPGDNNFRKVANIMAEKVYKNGGDSLPRFISILEKPQWGGVSPQGAG